jgi:hypothetical protein
MLFASEPSTLNEIWLSCEGQRKTRASGALQLTYFVPDADGREGDRGSARVMA